MPRLADYGVPGATRYRRTSVVAVLLGLLGACNQQPKGVPTEPVPTLVQAPSPREMVLAEHSGTGVLDDRIRELQARARASTVPEADLERLGWAFIARAREAGDAGDYNMALQCALAIEADLSGSHAALLLRGHALHSLHHFAEAETVARELVRERGLSFDHGLLGDVLLDRGRLDKATAAYQRMVDMRPDMHSYGRAAHVRFLRGDLSGALKAMEMAARAASPRNRESFAWTWSRLALYQLRSGATETAFDSAERALQVWPESHHALIARARILLAQNAFARAAQTLRAATRRAPHPDALWMLGEALQALGHDDEARATHSVLLAMAKGEDPRGLALYLATRGKRLPLAERLMWDELDERQDVYTYEALGWVQSARGEHVAALDSARRSLAAGTRDARLFYHAGLIADRAGDPRQARRWLQRASGDAHMLLPSQRETLEARLATL